MLWSRHVKLWGLHCKELAADAPLHEGALEELQNENPMLDERGAPTSRQDSGRAAVAALRQKYENDFVVAAHLHEEVLLPFYCNVISAIGEIMSDEYMRIVKDTSQRDDALKYSLSRSKRGYLVMVTKMLRTLGDATALGRCGISESLMPLPAGYSITDDEKLDLAQTLFELCCNTIHLLVWWGEWYSEMPPERFVKLLDQDGAAARDEVQHLLRIWGAVRKAEDICADADNELSSKLAKYMIHLQCNKLQIVRMRILAPEWLIISIGSRRRRRGGQGGWSGGSRRRVRGWFLFYRIHASCNNDEC